MEKNFNHSHSSQKDKEEAVLMFQKIATAYEV